MLSLKKKKSVISWLFDLYIFFTLTLGHQYHETTSETHVDKPGFSFYPTLSSSLTADLKILIPTRRTFFFLSPPCDLCPSSSLFLILTSLCAAASSAPPDRRAGRTRRPSRLRRSGRKPSCWCGEPPPTTGGAAIKSLNSKRLELSILKWTEAFKWNLAVRYKSKVTSWSIRWWCCIIALKRKQEPIELASFFFSKLALTIWITQHFKLFKRTCNNVN